jgi:hypothetical protein
MSILSSVESETYEPIERFEAPTLGELVGIDARREVVDLRTAVTPDRCRAMVSFVLGEPTDDRAERRMALIS